jgi:hypothetical protein
MKTKARLFIQKWRCQLNLKAFIEFKKNVGRGLGRLKGAN